MAVSPSDLRMPVILTPNTKANQCVICAKYVTDTRSRHALFRNGQKTDTSHKIEQTLHIRLCVGYQNVVCRSCFSQVKNTEKKQEEAKSQLHDLQQKFDLTCNKTHAKYGAGIKRQYIHSPSPSHRPVNRSPTKIPAPSPRKSPPCKKLHVHIDLSSPSKSKLPVPVKESSKAKKKLFAHGDGAAPQMVSIVISLFFYSKVFP